MDPLSPGTADPAADRPLSRAEEAAGLGISERHYRRVRARERDGTAPWLDRERFPHVPIVDREVPRRYYYHVEADHLSRLPLGPFRIGEAGVTDRREGAPSGRCGPGRLEGRLGIHAADEKFTDPPKPSRHKFRPKRPKKKKDRLA